MNSAMSGMSQSGASSSAAGTGGIAIVVVLLLLVVAVVACLVIYFVPTIVCIAKGTKRAWAIILINIFLGWTFFGWLGAFIWALCEEGRGKRTRRLAEEQQKKLQQQQMLQQQQQILQQQQQILQQQASSVENTEN